ncbi:DNA polymerase I [Cyanobacterium stanieri LEGE 03274]|uniref:DNA polymerase I n=1 Tax=Cyanobacterium stanieri LEGE 03274 TaxID=1828756 RepID=A0ABR9V2I6_9CHRO|nr:DNA polymerase I [Cyanobacterium stanieri]MBE9222083.1 DNA polymerase I [Cyanobacterium stanieri LEGE 03274]
MDSLFLLIDGHSLAYRAYYAFAKARKGALRTSTGIPTSVCYGFLNSLFQLIDGYQPELVAIAFDLREATFRHTADANYKSDRKETPDDFMEDLYNLQQLLQALNISIVTASGYEADDVLGTLALQGSQQDYTVKIVSGDRDLFQLVDDESKISVLYPDKNFGKYNEFTEKEVFDKMQVQTKQIVDFKALCGDKSDSIPGVLGIGEKTAVKLLQEYDNLANIYTNIDQIKGATQKKLINGEKDALHSQYLAQIITDIDLENNLENYQLTGINQEQTITLLEQLELKSFINQINKIQQKLGGQEFKLTSPNEAQENEQLSLFNTPNKQEIIKPIIIDSQEKLTNLITTLKQQTDSKKPTAWDTETNSLDTQKADLIGIGCCWGETEKESAYIPLKHTQGQQLGFDMVLEKLKPILENKTYPKTLQNAKFDRLVFAHQGIKLQGVVFDTMLASYVLQPEQSHKLSSLCLQYLTDIISQEYDDLGIKKGETIANLSIETAASYCALDAIATYKLTIILQEKLNKIPELQEVFNLEIKLEPILAQMEKDGIKIDKEYLEPLSQEIGKDLEKIEQKAYELAGEKLNLSSPKQLSELLFEKLGLDTRKTKKTKTGYSTNQVILEKLEKDHPIIPEILQHRTLSKLKSTYIDSLPTLINPHTQRIHTNYNQTVTATGRLSSSNPNLQNIPIRSEFSKQIRRAFIPQENWLFLGADYSQIELRILAHLSQEPILIEAYQNNQDIHTVTAQLLLDKKEIDSYERNLGKTINFGVIYGMGAQKFARKTGVSVKEAQKFIQIYQEKYAGIFNYLERMKKEALGNGYVTTILGRRRYFNFGNSVLNSLKGQEINSINLAELKLNNYDAQALRAAANAPIQGSSADIIKMAMVKISELLSSYETKLLLQVHDELVFEIPPHEVEELTIKIKNIMENVINLSIPLIVDINIGKNWMEAK